MDAIIAKRKHIGNSNLHIPLKIANCYDLRMNNKEVRYLNLTKVLKRFKTKRAFAEACDLAPGHVSQMFNKTRDVGDKVAAKIEQALQLPRGWMDARQEEDKNNPSPADAKVDEMAYDTHVISFSNATDLSPADYIFISRYNIQASAGNGCVAWQQDKKELPQAFRREFLQKNGLKETNLRVIYAKGDSMEPRIYGGDSLTIDISQKDPINEKIYVIVINDEVLVKQIRKRPGGGLDLISLNSSYPIMTLTPSEVGFICITGRVIQISSMGGL